MKRKTITPVQKVVIVVGLIFVILASTYIGIFAYAIQDYNSFTRDLEPPDSSNFLSQNSSRLYAMAMWYEKNIAEHHMPHNMIVDARFDTDQEGGSVIGYGTHGDSAEWTGNYLAAEASRYSVHMREGNLTLAQWTLKNITKALNGIEKILYVADYDGMARYAWPIDEYPYNPSVLPDNHYLGSWNGTQYILEDDTSRDMHNGVIMGLGYAYLVVEDSETRLYIKSLVERMLDVLITQGFLYLNPEGLPNGTDLDVGLGLIGTSGVWTLAYLKVGALVNPEKYGDLYEKYALNLDYVWRGNMPETSGLNTVQGYYGLLLDWEVMFILIMLEDDTVLRQIYLEYLGGIYDLIKYDRNALFNCMWLIVNGINKTNEPSDMDVVGDVTDCLMRYYGAQQRLPGRDVPLNNDDITNPTSTKWLNFFENGLGSKLYPFHKEVFEFENISNVPLTPDKRPQTDYLWSRPPYWYYETNPTGTYEGPGVDYIIVYWMARLYGIIEPPTDVDAQIEVVYGL